MQRFFLLATLLLSLVFASPHLTAQDVLQIPCVTAPVVDGVLSAGEWEGAAVVEVLIDGNLPVQVYSVHDGENLYVAFDGPFGGQFMFPEVLIDPDNSKSVSWQPDDWWFHVSGTDCESQGEPNNYDLCEVEHDSWQGVPNFSPELSPNTIEIVLPFSKINVGETLPHMIGITFDLTNTISQWRYWPSEANSVSPGTWGTAVLLPKEVSSVVDGEGNWSPPVLMNLQ